jgi:opacity protein-like surface antigen
MPRPIRARLLCCALATCCAPAVADDLLGIYVGAGIGRTDLRQDTYQIDAHATGWKLLAGWRPISLLGVEAEYVDLGSKGVNTYADTVHVSTDSKATAAYVLGYLPVPLPWIDVYGKVGAARVKANTNAYAICPAGSQCVAPGLPASDDSSRTSIAWGAGLQFKTGRYAARVDYERFDGPQGDPALLSAEFIFNF